MIGANINAYFKAAMSYPVERLVAVMQGKDSSIPQAAAMMALQIKKPMVDAAKGQQAAEQPKQPSVKDQMAQEVSMLPENTGIMNLPAQNMEQVGMATGGIVAFGEGGKTQEESDRESLFDGFGRLGAGAMDILTLPGRAVAGAGESVITRPLRAVGVPVPYLPDSFYGGNRDSMTPYYDKYRVKDEAAAKPAAPAKAATPAPATKTDTVTDPWGGKTAVSASASTTKTAPAGVGIGGIPKFTPGKEGDLDTELGKLESRTVGRTNAAYDKLKEDTKTADEKLLEEQQAAKPKGKAQEGLEKLLAKEGEEAKGKEDSNLKMALINAGLAIAGGKSQYALQNIAEGAQVGTKQYQAGLDKLEEAAKERNRLAAGIEEARRAEEKGDWKELYAAKREINKAQQGIDAKKIDALSTLLGTNTKTAAELVANQNSIAARDRQVQYTGEIDWRKALLQNETERQKVAAMHDGNNIQKMLMAQQRGEDGFKNWLANNAINALDMQTKNPQEYFKLRDWFMREAHRSAGLPYTSGGGNSGAPKLSDEENAALQQYKTK